MQLFAQDPYVNPANNYQDLLDNHYEIIVVLTWEKPACLVFPIADLLSKSTDTQLFLLLLLYQTGVVLTYAGNNNKVPAKTVIRNSDNN